MTTRIGIVADPGLPERRAKALFADLQAAAKDHHTGEPAELYLRIGSFPMSSRGTVELHDNTIEVLEKYRWDRLIYLTDLPLSTRRPVISQCVQNGKATMLCLPAFGLLRAKLGLKQEMTRLVQGKMAGAGVPEENIDGYEDIAGGDVRADTTRVLEGRGRTLRLLLGMIRCNRPMALLRALSGSIALGVASGAFGVFFGSIWLMSSLMPIWRLILISMLAICGMTFWLIYNNSLWNPRSSKLHYDSVGWWRARWDNYATLVTVAISSLLMYLLLIGVLLLLAAAVVPVKYFSLQIGHPVELWNYLLLAWFAASLGMIAGALGSGFDSEEAIQQATYNRRELERRAQIGLFDREEPGFGYYNTDTSLDITPPRD